MFFGWVNIFSILSFKLILIQVIFLISSMTVSHALLFADTDESFQAVLSLLDKDAFSEQKQITEYLNIRTKEIDELVLMEQNKIDLLKEYRQSLISEVITGKIDVGTTNLN